jgi:signal transduction histidine kinase
MDTYETSIYTAVIITGLVLGCIIVYFAFAVFRQQRTYIKMQRKTFSDEINLLEKERHRVARDLHDELGPLLSLAKSHISLVKTTDEKGIYHIEKSNEKLSFLIKRMGQIAINLTPGALARKGLHFTLDEYFRELADVCPIRFVYVYEVKSHLDLSTGIHLYRIIQEITHNAIKHSRAASMEVRLKELNQKLYIFCKDDGVGFAPESNREKRQGLGMGSLKSRTAMLDGKMKCTSSAKDGTAYFFEFPLFKKK